MGWQEIEPNVFRLEDPDQAVREATRRWGERVRAEYKPVHRGANVADAILENTVILSQIPEMIEVDEKKE